MREPLAELGFEVVHQAALVFHPRQRAPPLKDMVHDGQQPEIHVALSPEGGLRTRAKRRQ